MESPEHKIERIAGLLSLLIGKARAATILLGIGAAALEALAYFAITLQRNVYHVTGIAPCGGGCVQLALESVPTHPYFVVGVLLAIGGGILAGLAVLLVRRRKRALAIGSAT